MPLRHLLTVVFALAVQGMVSQLPAQEGYESRMFRTQDDKSLPYCLLTPANFRPDADQKYPLVIFLHGAGERGTDNRAQLVHCTGKFLEPDVRKEFPCFVIAPQCPQGQRWVEVDWGLDRHDMPEQPSEPLALVTQLVDQLQMNLPIDSRRIYVMGLSMGGYGTWDLVCRQPSRFAAAVPICGGADEAQAPRIAKVPVWAFHGDKDTVVKPERSRRMIEALKTAGAMPKYTEYPGVGHNSWSPAINEPGLLEWLFAQQLAESK